MLKTKPFTAIGRTAICLMLVAVTLTALFLNGALNLGVQAASMPEADGRKEVDIWLIGGQSNAVGYGEVSAYPTDAGYAEDKAMLTAGSQNVWFYGKDEGVGNDPTEFVPSGFGLGQTTGRSGAELGITTALNGNGRMNAIIKLAYGSSYVYPNTGADISIKRGTWTSPSYIEKHGVNVSGNKTGDLYWAFLDTVEEGLRQLTEKGYTPVIRGMWWMQGEAETFNATTSGAYEECLTYFINDIRASLSELSGTDCSAMPFVLGRLYRNPDQPHSAPQYLAAVQAGQDAVAANTSLGNVFKVDGATDLIDPASGKQTLPKQQDGWHFDALTQQMLGEAFVAKATSVDGELTRYGYIPTDYANAATYPLALFKATATGYEFLKGYGSWKTAFQDAVAQTNGANPKTEEAVLLLRRDFESTEISQHGGNVTSSVTFDLNGYTFAAKGSFTNTKTADNFTGVTEETLRNGSVTVKNGRLLVGSFGLLYTAKNGTLTLDKEITYNFEDLYLGFAEGATSTKLLVQAASTHTNKNVTYNVNVTDCTVDMVTNAPANAILGALNTGTSCMSDHAITFKDCEFIADKVSKLSVTASAEGDYVRYIKGANGYFGTVTVPGGGSFDFTAEGIEGDNTVTVSAKAMTADSGAAYALVASGSVTTAYAPIPQNYADAAAYPFAVFTKTEGGYSFVGAYNNWQSTMNKAIALTHGANGTTEEAVVLLRADHVTSQIVYNTSDIGTVVTVDLGGHTLTAKGSFCNTKTDDYTAGLTPETVKSGTINVKNGGLLMGAHGILYSAKNGTYTVEKSLTFNFNSVYIGYCEGATSKTLLARAYDSHIGVNTTYNMNFENCIIDMETNAPESTVIGDLEADKNCYSDHNITFKGCTFITSDVKNLIFVKSTEGDSVKFIKDENGKYSKLLLRVNAAEPDGTVVFDTMNGGQVMPTETADTEGLYKVCVFSEVISSDYGIIPNAYADSTFAVFTNTGNGYLFDSAHNGWNAAMGRAITLTHAATGTAKEAVVLLMKDHKTTDLLKNTFAIGNTVTVDLGGNTLTVCTSFCNTQTADYSGVTAANAKNGTINVKNGTLLVRDFGLVYTAMGGGSYTVPRTLYMNYEDLTIGFSDDCENGKDINLLTHAYGGSASVKSSFVFNYKNCVFDMVTNTTSASRLGRAQTVISGTTESSNTAFELTFDANCVFKVYDPEQISFTTKSASGDTIEFAADANGDYAKALIPTAAEPAKYSTILENTTGIALGLQYARTENGYDVYELFETEKPEDVVTPYGTIPAQYTDADIYPFVYFDGNGNFKGAYSLFYGTNGAGGVIGEAKTYLRDANVFNYDKQQYNSPEATAYVLMRRDYTMSESEYHDNNAQVQGVMNIDLGGFTLYQNKRVLFPSCAKGWSGSGDAKVFHTTFVIRNGGIALKDNYLAELSAWDSTGDGAIVNKNYTHVFENVRFSLVQGATAKGLIRHSVNNATPTAVTTFFFSFTDCEFDLKTVPPVNGFTLFTASHEYVKTVYTFTGCEITADTLENVVLTNITNGSAIANKNAEGKYLSLALPEGIIAPESEFYTVDGTKLAFTATDGGYVLTEACAHSYDNDFDATCNNCGEEREVAKTEGALNTKITWSYADGVLTVTGRGKIKNFSAGKADWSALADYVDTVVIGEGITYIGASAFYGFTKLDTVNLPTTLTAIGNYAFYGCTSLKNITIPENVTEIGAYAFRRSALTDVIFAIGYGWSASDNAFTLDEIVTGGATYLATGFYKSVWTRNVDAEVEEIDPNFVDGGICGNNIKWTITRLENGKLKLTVSGNGAMPSFGTAKTPWFGYASDIVEIEVCKGITTIGRCAFYGLKFVRKATIADTVTAIGEYGFYMCFLLKSIDLPEGVTIGKDAFVKTGVDYVAPETPEEPEIKDEPVLPNMMNDFNGSIVYTKNVASHNTPFAYKNAYKLFENKTITKIGIPVIKVRAIDGNQTFTLHVVNVTTSGTLKDNIVKSYTLTLPVDQLGNDPSNIKKFIYVDVSGLNIVVGKGQTLAFGASTDTVTWGWGAPARNTDKYAFFNGNMAFATNWTESTVAALSGIYFDVYAVSAVTEEVEAPVIPGMMNDFNGSVVYTKTVASHNTPFAYKNIYGLFENKKITKIGIPVIKVKALNGNQTFTLHVVNISTTGTLKDNIVKSYTLTLPVDQLGNDPANIKKFIYVDVSELNIVVGEGQTLAFGASTDTVTWGWGAPARNTDKYAFFNGNMAFAANWTEGTTAASGIYFDVYAVQSADETSDPITEALKKNGITNMSILGDSISTYNGYTNGSAANTTNSTISSNGCWYYSSRGDMTSATYTWWYQANEKLGLQLLVNNSYSGDQLAGSGLGLTRCEQLHDDTGENAGTNPDLIAVYFGTNDIGRNVSADTFRELYAQMVDKMQAKYKDAHIFLFTLTPFGDTDVTADELNAYNAIIREIAKARGCYVVDLYANSGINWDNYTTYTIDGTHPNQAGMDLITACFIDAIEKAYV